MDEEFEVRETQRRLGLGVHDTSDLSDVTSVDMGHCNGVDLVTETGHYPSSYTSDHLDRGKVKETDM